MLKRYFLLLCLLCSLHAASAQEFVSLPAEAYPVGTWYESQLAGQEAVVCDYPEFAPLTRKECRLLEKVELPIGYDPVLEQTLTYERKEPVLQVRLLPFVKRNGRYLRLTSVHFSAKNNDYIEAARAVRSYRLAEATSDRYAAKSVLAEGKWVKIYVEEEGIYQLSASQLSQMGFSNPERVKLYGYGGRALPENFEFSGKDALTDDLCEVPLYRSSGKLLFFAEGVTRWTYQQSSSKWTHAQSPYSLRSYYFLTEGDSPQPFSTLAQSATGAEPVSSVLHHAVYDKDAFSWYEGGREFYDSHNLAATSQTFSLATPSIVENEQATIDIACGASSPTQGTTFVAALNGERLGTIEVSKYSDNEDARGRVETFKSKALKADGNAFKLTVARNIPSRLDYIRVNYQRRLSAADAPYAFCLNTPGAVTLEIANATAQTRLWRIADGESPVAELQGTLTGTTYTATVPDGQARYVIVNLDAKYQSPNSEGTVANQDLHGDHSAYDMVIITPDGGLLDEQAERLAEFHRQRDGLRVKRVNATQLYNEFSSGTPDASAYRRYLKMLYDRATSAADMPSFVLFFGDCLWDNRRVTSEAKAYQQKDFLLSYENSQQTATSLSLGSLGTYPTDDYFGLLDDGEGRNIIREKIDLGIGRIPCHDAATAKTYVDKLIAYADNANAGSWQNRAVFVADDGDNNLHMRDAEAVISTLSSATGSDFIVRKVYQDVYERVSTATGKSFPEARKQLLEEMRRGALMFNYTGHGSPRQLSHSNILLAADFSEATSLRLPLWVFASCEITPYDQQEEDIGKRALFNKAGGAVAVMCSSRAVYASYNRTLNDAFCRYVAGSASDGRRYTMGDALRLCKNQLISSGSDATSNKLKYALLGDPALALWMPTGKIVLDSIAGEALTAKSFLTLKAGQRVRIAGHVDGQAGFTGTVTASVYDREETFTSRNNSGSAEEFLTFTDRPNLIYEGSDSVVNGRFSLEIIVPRSISYTTDPGLISLFAVDNAHARTCHGSETRFCLNGTDASAEPDTLAPVIHPYLGDPDFIYGGVVGGSVLFGATITDDCGIDATGNLIGHDMELIIDGNTADARVLNDYFVYDFGSYRSGTVAYQLDDIGLGQHYLTFRAWDVNDNASTVTLSFIVKENLTSEFDVYATANPTSTQTNFIVSNIDLTESTSEVVLEVYDVSGRRVWTRRLPLEGSGYVRTAWNLCDGSGRPLHPGIYIYRAISSGGKKTEGKKIIILNR